METAHVKSMSSMSPAEHGLFDLGYTIQRDYKKKQITTFTDPKYGDEIEFNHKAKEYCVRYKGGSSYVSMIVHNIIQVYLIEKEWIHTI